MTKKEFIENNQYLRKGMQNLTEEDLQLMIDIWQWKIDLSKKDNLLKIKQVVYHMQKWMSLWEMRWLIKAFKTLQNLPG